MLLLKIFMDVIVFPLKNREQFFDAENQTEKDGRNGSKLQPLSRGTV